LRWKFRMEESTPAGRCLKIQELQQGGKPTSG
jgi:hypothetical protein